MIKNILDNDLSDIDEFKKQLDFFLKKVLNLLVKEIQYPSLKKESLLSLLNGYLSMHVDLANVKSELAYRKYQISFLMDNSPIFKFSSEKTVFFSYLKKMKDIENDIKDKMKSLEIYLNILKSLSYRSNTNETALDILANKGQSL